MLGSSIFLLPHQDDEFGVFHILDSNLRARRRSICVYLTDGASNGDSSAQRDRESARVLSKFGLTDQDIIFLGGADRARDRFLVDALEPAVHQLDGALANIHVDEVYAPAWEGGHPDHDAATLLAHAFTQLRGMQRPLLFPLYNAFKVRLAPFKFFFPIHANGMVQKTKIPIASTVRHLRHCWTYKTQRKTWAALLPAMTWHYLSDRNQYLQEINKDCLHRRPHSGLLFYERRKWLTWDDFARRSETFRSRRLRNNI
jgi:LmbE family N-acetylglucosaminyl deacetylase